MDEKPKPINLLLPIVLLLFLVISGVVIALVVSDTGTSQAPEDSSAADNSNYSDSSSSTSTTSSTSCGDLKCSSAERAANRCEKVLNTWTNYSKYITVSCKTSKPISATCRSDCTWCGDGTVQIAYEQCDPVKTTDGSCSSDCKLLIESISGLCGDGKLDSSSGESCDPSLSVSGCPSGQTCTNLCVCVNTDVSGTVVTLPETAIMDKNINKIIFASGLVLSGLLVMIMNRKITAQNKRTQT